MLLLKITKWYHMRGTVCDVYRPDCLVYCDFKCQAMIGGDDSEHNQNVDQTCTVIIVRLNYRVVCILLQCISYSVCFAANAVEGFFVVLLHLISRQWAQYVISTASVFSRSVTLAQMTKHPAPNANSNSNKNYKEAQFWIVLKFEMRTDLLCF